jgi:hypothetical protein
MKSAEVSIGPLKGSILGQENNVDKDGLIILTPKRNSIFNFIPQRRLEQRIRPSTTGIS